MTELIDFAIVFVSTLISLAILGLIAGFSPTLYIAQATLTVKNTHTRRHSLALMGGVFAAIVLLLLLFQTIHLETLRGYIGPTVQALTASVLLNISVGIGLIYGGFYYLRHRSLPKTKEETAKLKKTQGVIGLVGLGFVKTLLSVGGVTATYVAGNVIADVGASTVERAVYTLPFLAVTVLPFVIGVLIARTDPTQLAGITRTLHTLLERINYRLIVGGAALIFGSSIVIFNAMIALFY